MAVKLGRGASLGFGAETTWGTAVARTNWMRVVSTGIDRTIDKVPRPHLGTLGATSANRRSHFLASDMVAGDFEVIASYDDSTLLLLEFGMGAVATTGAGPYVHTFTLTEDLPEGLTVEQIFGTGGAEVYAGCMVTNLGISCAVGDVMRLTGSVIGSTSAGRTGAPSPTYSPLGASVIHHQAGVFGFDGDFYNIKSMDLKVDNKLATRQQLGTLLTSRPNRSDFMEVAVSVTLEYSNDNMQGELYLDTQGDATITFTGLGNNVAAFTFQNAYITSVSTPVSGTDVIELTVDFVCESDGTDEGLSIAITNDNPLSRAN